MGKLTEAEKKQARRLYVSNPNSTVDDLADAYGVARSTMLRVLAGLTRPRGGRPAPVPDARLRRMRDEQGLTYATIGQQVGLAESTVWRRLNGR